MARRSQVCYNIDEPDRSAGEPRESSSAKLEICRNSKRCHRKKDGDGCTDRPLNYSNSSVNNGSRESSSKALGACRCSKLCYMTKERDGCTDSPPNASNSSVSNAVRESSSQALGACRCSKLCHMTKERDGCTDSLPNASNSSVSNAVRECSSQALGVCRCSRLCHMTKERDGCTDSPPDASKTSISTGVRESSSQALGACRCSKLCYMTKERDGCTDKPCNYSNSSVSNAGRKSSSQVLGACRCSKLCYMTKERDGCTDSLTNASNSSVSNAVRESSSQALGACRCSKLCHLTKERDGCSDSLPNASNSSVSNAVRESSSQALGACRCSKHIMKQHDGYTNRPPSRASFRSECGEVSSKLCHLTKERDGCRDSLPNASNSSVSNAVRESSSQALGACRCSKHIMKQHDGYTNRPPSRASFRSECGEVSSKLCHMTKERDGCTDNLPNAGNSSVSNAVRESSSQALGACRCSKLCHMTKERDGCTGSLPTRSSSSVGDGVRESSSQALGACRCSKLCHMTKERDGCTGSLPTRSNSSVGDGVRESPNQALGACRCSKHIIKQHDGYTNRPPSRASFRSECGDNCTGALGVCRRPKVCYDMSDHGGYAGNSPQRSSSSSSSSSSGSDDVKKRPGGALGTCDCCDCSPSSSGGTDRKAGSDDARKRPGGALGTCDCCDCSPSSSTGTDQQGPKSPSGSCDCTDTNDRAPERGNGRADDPSKKASTSSSCPCSEEGDTVGVIKQQKAAVGAVDEAPVKEPKPDANAKAAVCGCVDPTNCVDLNAFSLDSTDLKYLQQVKRLTQQDHKLKCELQNLAAQEAAMRSTIKSCDKAVRGENVTDDDDIKTLRCINKELTSTNENLTDKVQDLRLELEQLSQRIYGPMTRELERVRKKYIQTRSEMNRYKQCECIGSGADKLSLMSSQLQKTQENIADMALVNDGIKQEVAVLECKCNNMEDILIKQKVNEIDAINKLQTSDKDRESSVATNSTDKGDMTDTTSCSCTDA